MTGYARVLELDAEREKVADRLAVQIVTLVADRISKDGKLYAYDGIEAAREVRRLILEKMP